MGKDLKGKEIGAGIYQRKDKKYSARFASKATGKRVEKYFEKPIEAKNGLLKQNERDNGVKLEYEPIKKRPKPLKTKEK